MTSTLISTIKPDQRINQSLVFSSQQRDWNGILVHHYQNTPTLTETEIPALLNHWIQLPLGKPIRLIQKRDDRLRDSIVQTGDSIFVPAGQPSYWHCWERNTCKSILHIYLKPELIAQVAETSDLNGDRINLVNCFSKQDLQLQQIAIPNRSRHCGIPIALTSYLTNIYDNLLKTLWHGAKQGLWQRVPDKLGCYTLV